MHRSFSDSSPVAAHSFVDARDYGPPSTNAQLQQSFYAPIVGLVEVARAEGLIFEAL